MDFRPVKIGKYVLLEKLATGGMAEVYRGKSSGAGGFEKQLAIKRILPNYSSNDDFRRMFEYEARLSGQLTHANIVQVYDFVKAGETYLLAMEYIDGKNLRQFVTKCRKLSEQLPVEFCVFVINEVCKGLDYAHRKKEESGNKPLNIIHRDMSPQNVMMSYEGAVKIVDFGIAKAKDRVDETRSGVIKGKFGYMSPEQANGYPIDSRTDIFSTGIILFELMTGKRLFYGESDVATLRAIQECAVPPPSRINPKIPVELEKILLQSLTKDPAQRFQSAGVFQRKLAEYLNKHYPAYGQKEVGELMHRVFSEEIQIEKKRFEQLSKQSIPFSQGESLIDEETNDPAEEALEESFTKSESAVQTSATFTGHDEENEPSISIRNESNEIQENTMPSQEIVPPPDEPSLPTIGEDTEGSLIVRGEHAKSDQEKGRHRGSPIEVAGPLDFIDQVKAANADDPATKGSVSEATQPSIATPVIIPMDRSAPQANTPTPVSSPSVPTNPSTGPGLNRPEPNGPSLGPKEPSGSPMETVRAPQVFLSSDPEMENASRRIRERERSRDRDDDFEFGPPPSTGRLGRGSLLVGLGLLVAGGYGFLMSSNGVRTVVETIQPRLPTVDSKIPARIEPEVQPQEAPAKKKTFESCTVKIDSDPPGAIVKLGGELEGPSPIVLSGTCGQASKIDVELEGYEPRSFNFVFQKERETQRLKMVPRIEGELRLIVGVNAQVFIDGNFVGDAVANQPFTKRWPANRKIVVRLYNKIYNQAKEFERTLYPNKVTVVTLVNLENDGSRPSARSNKKPKRRTGRRPSSEDTDD